MMSVKTMAFVRQSLVACVMLASLQISYAQSELIVKFAWSQLVLADVEQSVYASQLSISQGSLESAQKRDQAGSIALVDFERAQ